VERAVSALDLTLSQYRLLGILGDGPEASSVLADKLAVSRPSVTGVVDGLVARGLVQRDPDASDRRRVGLGLTAEGREVLAAADDQVERRLVEIAAHVSEADAARAFAGLAPWRGALDAYRTARHARATAAPPATTTPARTTAAPTDAAEAAR
jgi:long-chain acyl-CoA synthetase